ncbi:MAG: AAA family ATPase, partial [Cyanobacteriota bacterium]
MPFLNPKLGIDFTDYIADRTTNFTGREWVFEAIQNWLADPKGERFFLLTGEPGSGKTAIAARLAQFAQGEASYPGFDGGFLHAVHFCSARDSVWTDPKEFVRSIALQLAQSIPEFGLALKDIGEKTNNINVDMSVGTAQNSTIQGVIIQNLTISGLTGQEAFTQVVVNPLRQIREEGFNHPVTILVDSLDEALTHDGESTIVGLLSKLSSGVKVRLILTSRNEARVKDKLVAYEELFLSAAEHLAQNQKDVRVYIGRRFSEDETLQNYLKAKSLDKEALTTTLIDKSEGNFLYVRFLLDSVASGQQSLTNLEGLPQGLDELYYGSLGRMVELGKKDWSDVYAPVMGVLLAAQESLTESQIRAFTKLKESVVWDCLNDLQQFLDVIESEDEEARYKFYHRSVTDFLGKRQLLICKKKQNNRYYLPAQEQHQRIVEYYRPDDKPWNEVKLEKIDPYGRRYLAQHLVQAERVEELHTLLNLEKEGKNAWFKVNDDEGDTASFLSDVELAWSQADEAYERDLGKSIGLQCRYALVEASINSLARIPIALMVALVKHQYWKLAKALAYTRQIPDPKERFESLATLAEQLPNSEPLKPQVLQSALQAAQAIKNEFSRVRSLIILTDKLPEALPKALEAALAIQHEQERVRSLIVLADKLPEALPKALEAALAIHDEKYRAEALTALADELTPELLPKALDAALAFQDEKYRAEALTALADELTPELLPKALDAALAFQDEKYRAYILIALAGKLPEALPKALEAALAFQDEKYHASALIALAGKLPAVLPKALEAALAFQDEEYRAEALTALADELTPELLPKALDAALAFQDEKYRASALIAL